MSARKVTLHIGIHKTGTSSIQVALKQGAAKLLDSGVIYPKCLSRNHSQFFYNAFRPNPENYHANVREGIDRETIRKRVAKQFKDLREEIVERPDYDIIFSGEDGCTFREAEALKMRDAFADLVPGAAFDVLIYTRHPVDYVESAVQENVKGNGLTIARATEIHSSRIADVYRKIDGVFSGVFGAENVRMRSFEATKSAGLIADFLDAVGLPKNLLPEVRSNESIPDEVVRFLSARHEAKAPPLDGESLQLLFALPGSRRTLFGEGERAKLWAIAADDVAFLKDRFAIDYENAGASGGKDERARFRAALEDAMPKLSEPARTALDAYLAEEASHVG